MKKAIFSGCVHTYAYNCIGDELAEKQNWVGAREYYELGGNLEQLVECYFNLEDYPALQATMTNLPENHALLPPIAEMFASVGMCSVAVECYLKCNQIQAAVDLCMHLNQWDQAIELASQYKIQDIKHFVTKYAEHLLAKDKKLDAIELYRKGNCYLEAARLLYELAESESSKTKPPLHRVKKLYVLAALMVEEHKKKANSATASLYQTNETNEKESTLEDSKLIETAWDGAVAFHFLHLAHQQLYGGHTDLALHTALHLQQYEELMNAEVICCIIALASLANRAFATCARAFANLQALDTIDSEKKRKYDQLARLLFMEHTAKDGRVNRCECTTCETMIPDTCSVCPNCGLKFPTCLLTGRSLMNADLVWTCVVCKHCADARLLRIRSSCPLCHTALHF